MILSRRLGIIILTTKENYLKIKKACIKFQCPTQYVYLSTMKHILTLDVANSVLGWEKCDGITYKTEKFVDQFYSCC